MDKILQTQLYQNMNSTSESPPNLDLSTRLSKSTQHHQYSSNQLQQQASQPQQQASQPQPNQQKISSQSSIRITQRRYSQEQLHFTSPHQNSNFVCCNAKTFITNSIICTKSIKLHFEPNSPLLSQHASQPISQAR